MADFGKLRKQQQKSFKCEICDKEFKSNNGLKNHFNIVHKLIKEHQLLGSNRLIQQNLFIAGALMIIMNNFHQPCCVKTVIMTTVLTEIV